MINPSEALSFHVFWFLVNFQPLQINNCADLGEEIHSNDSIHVEAVIHGANFNFKLAGFEFAK